MIEIIFYIPCIIAGLIAGYLIRQSLFAVTLLKEIRDLLQEIRDARV